MDKPTGRNLRTMALCLALIAVLLISGGCKVPASGASRTPTPAPTLAATPDSAPTPEAVPTPDPAPTSPPLPLSGKVIGIDPGHQNKANYDKEPVAPGSTTLKAKTSSGTQGVVSKVPEYVVTLKVGLELRALLEAQGATVVMTREKNDVNISNSQRAKFFNEKQTDYAIRLHCDSNNSPTRIGAHTLIPHQNPFQKDCERAGQVLIDAFCARTGAKNLGSGKRSDQTGFNFCERMIVNIEMGYMSNKEEDKKLVDADYQKLMAQGILDGILAYFAQP